MKRSCENKQQLTLCHIWQWSSSPHGVSTNPFLSREKRGILQTPGIKTNSGDAKDTSQIQCQYHYSLSFSIYYAGVIFPFRWTSAKLIFEMYQCTPWVIWYSWLRWFPLAPCWKRFNTFRSARQFPVNSRATPARVVLYLASRRLWKWQSQQRYSHER